jgi:hypothetical protein
LTAVSEEIWCEGVAAHFGEILGGVVPGPHVDAAVPDVVLFLDRAVELAHRIGKPARRDGRKIVRDELGGAGGRCK